MHFYYFPGSFMEVLRVHTDLNILWGGRGSESVHWRLKARTLGSIPSGYLYVFPSSKLSDVES